MPGILNKNMQPITYILFLLLYSFSCYAENGYDLWLRYKKITDIKLLAQYQKNISSFYIDANSQTLSIARKEFRFAAKKMLGINVHEETPDKSTVIISLHTPVYWKKENLGNEGFAIYTYKGKIYITADRDIGLLYGTFHFLRMLQMHQSLEELDIRSIPKIANRILNHWDNPSRTVERGYAGISIWNWHTLPDFIDQRYIDYARANASIGINGTVVSNVNANSIMLTPAYLLKLKALADVFRPYGIRVYLTARFSAPIELGRLPTADPMNNSVRHWWKNKANEIYQLIPDFGGFLIKANSEGQPGPQTYNRSHADGANMLADAVAPHGGIIIWRAFVYDARVQKHYENFENNQGNAEKPIASEDRFKQAFHEFKPLDGLFKGNVIIQVKNGPIDFQPREPFSPLFGAMERTPIAMEFQITQEYLGQGTHLVFEAPLFKEVLDADTKAKGTNSTVARVIDGTLSHQKLSVISGVSNIGNDINWTGHPFGQANWYAFGRLAWNHDLSSQQIASEWVRQTFSNENEVVETITSIMLASREAVVNYMTPLGLHHIMATGHHYGPGPWVNNLSRDDWNPVYYHRADSMGIGFNRTITGSNALAQYQPEVARQWSDSNTCDEKYLLWFHHVSWSHTMKNNKSLWDELCTKYQEGVDTVRWMQKKWGGLKNYIDGNRYRTVNMLLTIQEKEAVWWRNACLLYFQTFSKLPLPPNVENPDKTLKYYENLQFPYAPGINGNN